MNEDYTQPFFVGINNPRFPHSRFGYLPSLEPRIELEIEPRMVLTPVNWDLINQLQSEVRGWRQKHAEALLAIDRLTKKILEGGDLT